MYFGSPGGAKTAYQNPTDAPQLNDFVFCLKECTKPEYKIDVSEHVLINHTFRYPKNLVWQPVQVKMVTNFSDKEILSKTLNKVIYSSGYVAPTAANQTQISKAAAIFDNIEIIQIDEGQWTKQTKNGIEQYNQLVNTVEVWNLRNAFISNINYGSLSYEEEGFVDISFTLNYDYAFLNEATYTEVKELLAKISSDRQLQSSTKAITIGVNDALDVENVPQRNNSFGDITGNSQKTDNTQQPQTQTPNTSPAEELVQTQKQAGNISEYTQEEKQAAVGILQRQLDTARNNIDPNLSLRDRVNQRSALVADYTRAQAQINEGYSSPSDLGIGALQQARSEKKQNSDQFNNDITLGKKIKTTYVNNMSPEDQKLANDLESSF